MHCQTLVLGAGIVGVSTALHLQARGRQVVLIDRDEPGSGTSHGNAGLIERSSVIPYAFPRQFGALLRYGLNRQPDVARLHATGSGLDGWDARLLDWIVDSRLACLIADNPAVELVVPKLMQPSATGGSLRQPRLPLHEHCLFKNGIHLGELWYLTELAAWLRAHGRSRASRVPAHRSSLTQARCPQPGSPCPT